MKITIDTNEPLSPADIDILTDIVNRQTGRVVETTMTYDGPKDEPHAGMAERLESAIRRDAATDAEANIADDTDVNEDGSITHSVPVTEEPEQGAYDVDGAPTRQDAIDAATLLMTQGHRDKVIAALTHTSVSRVSELEGTDINVFLERIGEPKAADDE